MQRLSKGHSERTSQTAEGTTYYPFVFFPCETVHRAMWQNNGSSFMTYKYSIMFYGPPKGSADNLIILTASSWHSTASTPQAWRPSAIKSIQSPPPEETTLTISSSSRDGRLSLFPKNPGRPGAEEETSTGRKGAERRTSTLPLPPTYPLNLAP